ncbi:MAG: hypothetical protein JXA37_05685 [Chloroflexia bacterium]|nr:hypothetical protein [Chloroflexia bacterium]
MKQPILFRRDDVLDHEQARYWKDLLYRTLKIGTEVEFAMPKGVRKNDLMPLLWEALQPTKDLGHLGRYGVLDVISEHCGIEIQVIGRQPYYAALRQQYQELFALLPEGIRARPTCGLHYHVLGVGLCEAVPEIVLANIWNLTRRYAPELRFLSSAGEGMAALCRRRNHTSHLEMVKHSPALHRMAQIQQFLKESRQVPEHQNFMNLEHLRFDEPGDVVDFHLEFRFPDADLSPTSIVAKTFLFLALVLKSVDMSQYGVIHVGKIREWRRKIELLDLLSNNEGKLATSDTSGIGPDEIEELRVGARELLELLKPAFVRLARVAGDSSEEHPAFEVLSLLAETPISLLRSRGRDWVEVEALLAERAETPVGLLDPTELKLMRCIELAELSGCPGLESWKWQVAQELFLTPRELEQRLDKLDRLRGLRWDLQLGTMVFTS